MDQIHKAPSMAVHKYDVPTTADVSYICVMRLQCSDGEIQLFASATNNLIFANLHMLTKSYLSGKDVTLSVEELIASVENPPNLYGNINAATQTDENDLIVNDMDDEKLLDKICANKENDIKRNNANVNCKPKLEFDVDSNGMNDSEFLDFLDSPTDDMDQVDSVILDSEDNLTTDDLMLFVKAIYENNSEQSTGMKDIRSAQFLDCPFKCGFCEKTFTRHNFLESHMTVMHSDIDTLPLYRCSYCNKPFEHSQSLRKHFVTHMADKPYKCKNHCQMSFGSKQQLQRHILIVKGVSNHKCVICGKKWPTKAGLKGHMVVHSGNRSFQCIDCGTAFARKSQLTRHTLLHKNERNHVCSWCGKSFLRAHDVTRHAVIHEAIRKRPFKCRECGKTFTKAVHLTRHEYTHTSIQIS